MMRVLSWLVLILCCLVMSSIVSLISFLIAWGYDSIYRFSVIVFWIVLVIGSLSLSTLFYSILMIAAGYVVSLSERVCTSRSGLRYRILGGWFVLNSIVNFIGLFVGYYKTSDVHRSAIQIVLFAIFSVFLISCGNSLSKNKS